MTYATTNPYTGETVATFPTLTDDELEAKLAKANEAFKTWSKTSIEERAAVMRRAADLMIERRDELAAINTLETGKLIQISAWEMNLCADIFRHYADHAAEYLKPERIETGDKMSGNALAVYQPLGIIYMIEPWNVPFFQMSRPGAAQLMAGNVVVLKHASNCPQCALSFEKLLLDAGLPEGCFTNLFVNYEQSDRIIADPRVCGVTITGSTEVGRGVSAKAGAALKKNVMELGGSDAMVVMPDADLNKTVQGALLGRLTNSGQVCAGDKRMFVHESLYDAFLAGVTQACGQLVAGDPMDQNTTFGPVCNGKAAAKVKSQIALAVEHGATATEVGPEVPEGDAWVRATILTNVTPDNPICQQEIFGPVMMVFSWSDEDEMMRLANGTDFGLGASVYTESPTTAQRIALELEAGAVSVNQFTAASPAIPFGGIKQSGFGREMGRDGIVEFTNKKLINSADMDVREFTL